MLSFPHTWYPFYSAQRERLYNGKLDNQNLKSIGKEQFERSRKQGTTPVINDFHHI